MNHPATLYEVVDSPGRGETHAPQHVRYRKFVSLGNGTRAMLRFLTGNDRGKLIKLFQEAPEEDVRLLKSDVKDPGVINHWIDNLNYGAALPLIAESLAHKDFVAAGVLRRGRHAFRHIGEIRLFVSRSFQNLGLGSAMLDELINLAELENYYWLTAEVVADQKKVIKALRSRGFEVRSTMEDFFLCPDGTVHDVVLMMRPVPWRRKEYF